MEENFVGYNYVYDFWLEGTLSSLEDNEEIDVYTIQKVVEK